MNYAAYDVTRIKYGRIMTCLWLRSVLFNPWQGINGRKWAGFFVWGFHLWTFYVDTPKLAMKGFESMGWRDGSG